MKKLLIAALALLGSAARIHAAPLYGYVQITTTTALTPTLQNGSIKIASGTIQNLNASTATFSGPVNLGGTGNTVTVSSNTILPGATFYASGLSVRLSTPTISGPMAMGSNKITGLATGTAASDAVNYGQLPASSGTITNWASYTPTITGCGTVNTVTFGWRRIGDSVEVAGIWISGTVAASAITIALPNGITVNGSPLTYDLAGTAIESKTGATVFYPIRASGGGTTVDIGKGASGSQFSSYNGSDIFTAGNVVYVHFVCPITGWSI